MQMGGKYYPRKVPHEGYINRDWTYNQIDAFIRALHFPPFKGATLKYKDKELEIDNLEQYIQTLQT
jgi:methionyl-tRNA formyltransferase